jgi:hypothetical protein
MKLKQKLMMDYVQDKRGHHDQYAEMLEECWLNAFHKARELANEGFIRMLDGENTSFGTNDILELGEEEIE